MASRAFSPRRQPQEKQDKNALPGIVISHQQKAIPILGGTILPRNYFKCICDTLWPMSCKILFV